ncbi:unnamed protein product [Tenebrio molitor]|nr:unnamed protein product [Tenebrio molitor]
MRLFCFVGNIFYAPLKSFRFSNCARNVYGATKVELIHNR